LERGEEPSRTYQTLLGQLEASLHGSRKALIALDLAGMERGTREQVVLTREIEAVRRRSIAPADKRTREQEEELRQSGNRVLAAARLQAALLVRARCKLRVLANMLADPSVNYGPLLARNGASPRVFEGKGAKRAGAI